MSNVVDIVDVVEVAAVDAIVDAAIVVVNDDFAFVVEIDDVFDFVVDVFAFVVVDNAAATVGRRRFRFVLCDFCNCNFTL